MDIEILSQNIVNNPNDFTAKQIEKHFNEYARLKVLSAIPSLEDSYALANKILEVVEPKLNAQEESFFLAGVQEAIKYINKSYFNEKYIAGQTLEFNVYGTKIVGKYISMINDKVIKIEVSFDESGVSEIGTTSNINQSFLINQK